MIMKLKHEYAIHTDTYIRVRTTSLSLLCPTQAGDATAEELSSAVQLRTAVMPIKGDEAVPELMEVTEEMKEVKAYAKLRLERMNVRMAGIRKKKLDDAEKDEKK